MALLGGIYEPHQSLTLTPPHTCIMAQLLGKTVPKDGQDFVWK